MRTLQYLFVCGFGLLGCNSEVKLMYVRIMYYTGIISVERSFFCEVYDVPAVYTMCAILLYFIADTNGSRSASRSIEVVSGLAR